MTGALWSSTSGSGSPVWGPQPGELRQRRRVERPRLDALDAELREPALQLAGGLLGERDREDLRASNAPLRHLARDPVGDRGGLAGPRAGQDRDRSAEGEGRLPLGVVQPRENALEFAHFADPSIASKQLQSSLMPGRGTLTPLALAARPFTLLRQTRGAELA